MCYVLIKITQWVFMSSFLLFFFFFSDGLHFASHNKWGNNFGLLLRISQVSMPGAAFKSWVVDLAGKKHIPER